ncbi:MAG: hypothetical protein QNJ40_11090 [Xanthomonadales bacterium]|nr:hypothetical protein [Xanthomonadales bacterium]
MTYLVGEIIFSLVLAAAIGGIVGWLACQWTVAARLEADLEEIRGALFTREAEINQLRSEHNI